MRVEHERSVKDSEVGREGVSQPPEVPDEVELVAALLDDDGATEVRLEERAPQSDDERQEEGRRNPYEEGGDKKNVSPSRAVARDCLR